MSNRCQGWPQYGCTKPSIATVAGYRLCRDCLFAHSQRDKDITIQSLRAQLAYVHEAIGAALALIRQQSYGAAEIILAEALRGNTMTDYDPPPDIPDEYPDPTPGGPPPPEW
jgi:hypothetical protein